MRILVLNGPNMGRLGRRPAEHYGRDTLAHLVDDVTTYAAQHGCTIIHEQSNHEGELVDALYAQVDAPAGIDAIIVNPAGLTYYGDSLYQSLVEVGLPVAVVHMSNVFARSDIQQLPWRPHDLFAHVASYYLAGLGAEGYRTAVRLLADPSLVGVSSVPHATRQ